MSRRKIALTSICVEVLGLMGISAGLAVELTLHADFGYGLITGGSLFVAGGGILWGKLLKLKP
jgi:hypothetical protein